MSILDDEHVKYLDDAIQNYTDMKRKLHDTGQDWKKIRESWAWVKDELVKGEKKVKKKGK